MIIKPHYKSNFLQHLIFIPCAIVFIKINSIILQFPVQFWIHYIPLYNTLCCCFSYLCWHWRMDASNLSCGLTRIMTFQSLFRILVSPALTFHILHNILGLIHHALSRILVVLTKASMRTYSWYSSITHLCRPTSRVHKISIRHNLESHKGHTVSIIVEKQIRMRALFPLLSFFNLVPHNIICLFIFYLLLFFIYSGELSMQRWGWEVPWHPNHEFHSKVVQPIYYAAKNWFFTRF